jgi:hypothetical protein
MAADNRLRFTVRRRTRFVSPSGRQLFKRGRNRLRNVKDAGSDETAERGRDLERAYQLGGMEAGGAGRAKLRLSRYMLDFGSIDGFCVCFGRFVPGENWAVLIVEGADKGL